MDSLSEPSDVRATADATRPVRDVVREVVSDAAPDELLLVEGLCRSDDESVAARLAARDRSDEPLGFGLGEIAALVTPVVWIALDEAARKATGAAVGGVGRRLRVWLRRIFRRPAVTRTIPPLTPDQLEAVRLRVLELSTESGMAPAAATALAERVVARLVLRPLDQLAGERGDGGEPAT
ncbi:hypothetical protein [Planosporangium thailandense]|uniref:hypothetical protein n=1 Tax=Planosporangium thailandense TaxID=765197 RepID=UPI00197C37AD|nr:hypothetical protein [Planosporangium thailandense]